MAEALGVVVAATQLTSYCLNLSEVLRTSFRAKTILQDYLGQVDDLHLLSKSIQLNPSLQISEVKNHTNAIIRIIQESTIVTALKKSRFLRALTVLVKEKELGEFFQLLDAKKSNLALCIANITCLNLHDLRNDIRSIFDVSSERQINISHLKTTTIFMPSRKSHKSAEAKIKKKMSSRTTHELPEGAVAERHIRSDEVIFNGNVHSVTAGRQLLGAMMMKPNEGKPLTEIMATHKYKKNVAEEEKCKEEEVRTGPGQDGAKESREQVCGVVFAGNSIPEAFSGVWVGNKMTGKKGDQILGLVVE